MDPRQHPHHPGKIRSRLFYSSVSLVLCGLFAGCGSGGSLLPSANTAPVAGVPSGPVLGYLWSATDQTLRPLLGVAGSSLVGQTVVPAGTYVAGAASSITGIGLLEDSAGTLFALHLPSPAATQVATALPGQARIVFSPSGTNAIAYVPGGSSITLLTGLATTVHATSTAVPAGLGLSSAVVSDAGTVLLATAAAPAAVGTLSASGQFARLASFARTGGMNFLPNAEDALVGDGGNNTVSLLHNVSGTFALQNLNAAGVNQPLAVASSQDARWALVANAGDQGIIGIDLKNGGTPAKVNCVCQATELSALAGGKAFRLNGLGSGPLWMVDTSASSPQLLFVPAVTKQ